MNWQGASLMGNAEDKRDDIRHTDEPCQDIHAGMTKRTVHPMGQERDDNIRKRKKKGGIQFQRVAGRCLVFSAGTSMPFPGEVFG